MHLTFYLCTPQSFNIPKILVLLLLLLPFTLFTHSFYFFVFLFILVRGEVLYVRFGRVASVTVVCRQVVLVGVAVSDEGKLQLLLDLDFLLRIQLTD